MSILIADSGSTKTEWRMVSAGDSNKIITEGLNPYYHTRETISGVISEDLKPQLADDHFENVLFYGAGCSRPSNNEMVKQALAQHFPGAEIEVNNDLLAAARACFFDESGIACILGTGSNSCRYDGQQIVEHIPSLGFVAGDEGSAGYFGKQLINHYFRRELPGDLKKELEKAHNMSLAHLMHGLHDGAHKSRFIASYSAFLGDHSEHPFIKKMLCEGFGHFVRRILKNYADAEKYNISFVGSVAFAYRHLIKDILKKEGLRPGSFFCNPLDRLVEYHTPS